MNLIQWTEEFAVGVPDVDADHRDLIDHVNTLYEELHRLESSPYGEAVSIVDFLGELLALFGKHFDWEETVMQANSYRLYAEHRADHERLLDEICRTMYDYQDGLLDDDAVMARMLSDWLTGHFRTHDAELHALIDVAMPAAR
jgi:hemerythrin